MQALKLKFDKRKSTKNKSYIISQELCDRICKRFNGREGACVKVLFVLLGSQEGFTPSLKWICDRTGLNKSNYCKVRKRLIELNIMEVSGNTLIINTHNI